MANWRTAFKSDFLASWDIDSVIQLTIDHVEVKEVQLIKKEKKVIAYFLEKNFPNNEIIKPMILNATNCKKLNTFTGTKETDHWRNIAVEIGVVQNTGKIGESKGLSIIRVLGIPVDKINELIEIYDKLDKTLLSEEEYAGIERVIANQEKASYDKCIRFISEKL